MSYPSNMRISIITPTYNRISYLDATINSIVSQQGDFELEYIIQDGGSEPELIAILEKWHDRIKSKQFEIHCNSIDFKYYVESDEGMYDAISRGFTKASGDIMAWLNSDDMYHPYALQTVLKVFTKYADVCWITGIPNSYNDQGSRAGFDRFPPSYSKKFLAAGYYDVKFLDYGFNWIQQESTFWRASLWRQAGAALDSNYRYAADFHLWRQFARYTDLVKVESFLGGFRVHDDQFTANPEVYRNELPEIEKPPFGLKCLRQLLNTFPTAKKLFFNAKKGFPLMNFLGLKFSHLTGRVIEWSFNEKEWVMRWKSII